MLLSPFAFPWLALVQSRKKNAYSPPLTLFVPKLLPTVPVHRHVLPALLVQTAVAVAPGVRHVIARFDRDSNGLVEASEVSTLASVRVCKCIADSSGDEQKESAGLELRFGR